MKFDKRIVISILLIIVGVIVAIYALTAKDSIVLFLISFIPLFIARRLWVSNDSKKGELVLWLVVAAVIAGAVVLWRVVGI